MLVPPVTVSDDELRQCISCRCERRLAMQPQVDASHEQGRRQMDDLSGGAHEISNQRRGRYHTCVQLALRDMVLPDDSLQAPNVEPKGRVQCDSCFTEAT